MKALLRVEELEQRCVLSGVYPYSTAWIQPKPYHGAKPSIPKKKLLVSALGKPVKDKAIKVKESKGLADLYHHVVLPTAMPKRRKAVSILDIDFTGEKSVVNLNP